MTTYPNRPVCYCVLSTDLSAHSSETIFIGDKQAAMGYAETQIRLPNISFVQVYEKIVEFTKPKDDDGARKYMVKTITDDITKMKMRRFVDF